MMSLGYNNLNRDMDVDVSFANNVSTPLFGLPVELWGEIFNLTLLDHPFIKPSSSSSPLLVSQICRDWRDVALSTPSLWAQLSVLVSDRTSIDFITLWLSRSASFPLSLNVYCRLSQSKVSTAFTALFASHLYHWRSLQFHAGPSIPRLPIIPPEGAPMLEQVSISADLSHPKVVVWFCSVMHAAPRLQMVRSSMNTQLDLPWARLSHMRIFAPSLDQALDVLAQALKLVECTFSFPSLPSQEVIHRPHILLPHLNYLSTNVYLTRRSLMPLFDHLTLPSLKTFTIIGSFCHSFLSLLSRSPACSLSSLKLSHTQIPESLLLECLAHPCIQSLSHLTVFLCANVITDRVLGFLTFRDGHTYPLPKLTTLEFCSSVCSTDGYLTDMVESRCPSQSLPRTVNPLKFVKIGGLDNKNDLSRLRALSVEGFHVVIF